MYLDKKTKLSPKEYLNPHFPEAEWNVSALFQHDDIILSLAGIMNDLLQCPNPIGSVHGCFPVRWNSGRVVGTIRSIDEIESTLLSYKELGIGVYFTFSNHLIEKADLEDKTCNCLLEMLDDIGDNNGVIISSDILSDYIRDKYPDLLQIASIIKVTMEKGRGKLSYYQEMEKRFDRVVIHLDDNLNFELLKQLDPKKIEILVNEPCVVNCPHRDKHYDILSKMSKNVFNIFEFGELDEHLKTLCLAKPMIKQLQADSKQRNCTLSFPEVGQLYKMGITHLKLQGRDDKQVIFLYDLIRYLFEPDYVAPLLYKSIVVAHTIE